MTIRLFILACLRSFLELRHVSFFKTPQHNVFKPIAHLCGPFGLSFALVLLNSPKHQSVPYITLTPNYKAKLKAAYFCCF